MIFLAFYNLLGNLLFFGFEVSSVNFGHPLRVIGRRNPALFFIDVAIFVSLLIFFILRHLDPFFLVGQGFFGLWILFIRWLLVFFMDGLLFFLYDFLYDR